MPQVIILKHKKLMKYKHKLNGLLAFQKAWEAAGSNHQNSTTKPGSQKKWGAVHPRPVIKHHKGHNGRKKKK